MKCSYCGENTFTTTIVLRSGAEVHACELCLLERLNRPEVKHASDDVLELIAALTPGQKCTFCG